LTSSTRARNGGKIAGIATTHPNNAMNNDDQAVKEGESAEIACDLCGGREVSVLSRVSRSGRYLRTVACRACGLVWSDPRPHDPRRFYEEDYRLAYKRTFEPRPRHVLRAGKVALSRLDRIRPYLSGRMRILDVGSGGGEFAYLLQTLGHAVTGIEPNRGYAEYSVGNYGLEVMRGFVGEVALPEGAYDLITIWHVLEHTETPGAVLEKLRRALKSGGMLVVEVPNVEATCQSPRSTFHEAHLYNFNAAALVQLAAKAGLRVRDTALSPDGGNITAVFRALDAGPPSAGNWTLPGNHDRVAAAVLGHTRLSHWLSLHPYRRAAARLARMVAEWRETRRAGNGRALLDELYRQALHARRPSPASERLQRPMWQIVCGIYALAILLEWLLLDGSPLMKSWTETEALGVYLALQSAVVLVAVRSRLRPVTIKRALVLAGWTAPLAALPSVM
jgi:2-polyprenyl-3-methyl-5-hydroxy-6-metoxy-1,4-benzoquinol methylase